MPVPHTGESPHLADIAQGLLQRFGLRNGIRKQGRRAAKLGVDLARCHGAPSGNRGSKRFAQQHRDTKNGRITEEVAQERPHRFGPVGTTQVEKNDRDTRHGASRRTRSTSRCTCSGGVSGKIP